MLKTFNQPSYKQKGRNVVDDQMDLHHIMCAHPFRLSLSSSHKKVHYAKKLPLMIISCIKHRRTRIHACFSFYAFTHVWIYIIWIAYPDRYYTNIFMYFHRHCTTVVDHYYAREKAIFILFPLPNITKESSKAFNRSFMHDFLFRFFGYPITSSGDIKIFKGKVWKDITFIDSTQKKR